MNFAPSFRLAAALIMLVGPGLSTWAQDHADASLKE